MKQQATIKNGFAMQSTQALSAPRTPYAEQTAPDTRQLLSDFRAYLLDLEMQNERLRNSLARLEKSGKHHAEIYNAVPVAQFSFNRNSVIRRANAAGGQLLGVDRSILIDRSFRLFISTDSQSEFDSFLQRVFAGKSGESCQLALHNATGTPLWVHMRASAVRHGEECHVALWDVTEQKRSARQESQRKAEQSYQSIGQLAGGVAQDFNNLLCVIIGHAEMALYDADPNDAITLNLQEIHKAAYRCAGITQQLLGFAGKQIISPQVLDLNQTIEQNLTPIKQLLGDQIDLSWTPGRGLWEIYLDPSQINLILPHFAVNAREAMEGEGSFCLATANVTLKECCGSQPEGSVAGEYVRLSLQDTGSGMTQDVLAHLFEPFYTTKEVGRGAGLGLATAYGIIRQNQGFIDVRSKPGQGTTFEIYLPRHDRRPV